MAVSRAPLAGYPCSAVHVGNPLRLEAFCTVDASDPFLAHVAAGSIEFLEGSVFQEKDPDPTRMDPRPFGACTTGRQPTYVFRDVLFLQAGSSASTYVTRWANPSSCRH